MPRKPPQVRRAFTEGAHPWHEKFRLWLTQNGITLAAFARKFGYSYSTIQTWVRGSASKPRCDPTFAMMRCLAEDTGVALQFWADDTIPFDQVRSYTAKALRRSFDQQIRRLGLTEDELREIADGLQTKQEAQRTVALRRAARPAP